MSRTSPVQEYDLGAFLYLFAKIYKAIQDLIIGHIDHYNVLYIKLMGSV